MVLGIVVDLAEDDVARAGSALEQLVAWNECGGARVPDTRGHRVIRDIDVGTGCQRRQAERSPQFHC
jgi:hypothetical protein